MRKNAGKGCTDGQVENHASSEGAGGFGGQRCGIVSQVQAHAVAEVLGQLGDEVILPLLLQPGVLTQHQLQLPEQIERPDSLKVGCVSGAR